MRAVPLLLLPLVLAGCVERLITIRSTPSGAQVYFDGELRGETPHVERYSFYGTREVTLVKKGYRTHRKMVELAGPWWQIFPLDLITDVLLPFTITDRVELDVALEKEPEGPAALKDVLKRAAEAREKANLPLDAPR